MPPLKQMETGNRKVAHRFHTVRVISAVFFCLLIWPVSLKAVAVKHHVTVAGDGTGNFRTVQSAVDSAGSEGLIILIKPGIYKEVLHIDKPGIELRGLGADPRAVVLTYDNSAKIVNSTTKSASTTVTGNDFFAENLTFENSFQQEHPDVRNQAQAVALLVSGDREIFRHVRFIGAQDTLYANSNICHTDTDARLGACRASRQYFADCYIEGHVDFIFGDAKAVFDHCVIHGIPHEEVTLTAQSKHNPDEDSGYVFNRCTITADPAAKSIYLGRPWRAYSTVIFLNTDMQAHIQPAGWLEWGNRLRTSYYAEYNSTGAGADPAGRTPFSHQLTAAQATKYATKIYLAGSDHWNPLAR